MENLIGKTVFLHYRGGVVHGLGIIEAAKDTPFFRYQFRNETGIMRFNELVTPFHEIDLINTEENMKVVEKAYKDYLQKVGLDENQMNEVQRAETKRAFFAGYGSCMAGIADEVEGETEEEEAAKIDAILNEISDFFKIESYGLHQN